MNIMIFGGLGKTSEPIVGLLVKKNHSLTIFDISASNPYAGNKSVTVVQGDICDQEAVESSLRGIDAILHLAVNVSDAKNDELSFRTNVFGTYNVFRGALTNKVPKVILAASAPVHTVEELKKLNNAGTAVEYCCAAGEDFTYDLTKIIQETIAGHFSRTYALNCLVLRLGHIVDGKTQTTIEGGPLSELSYCRGGWVCKYDVARAFSKAVSTDFTGFHLVNVIGSFQAADMFGLSAGSNILSFECAERFLEYGSI